MVLKLAAFALGGLGWTLAEYVLHRFVFHGPSAKRIGAREHRRHHAEVDYFAPAWQKAIAAGAAAALILPLASLAVGVAAGLAFTLGFIAMYIAYEGVHRRAHTHPPRGRYGRWLRRNHFAHHFVNPKLGQGVTSPVWDIVFGTTLALGRVRVPRRLALPWLVDASGEVWPAFADDYELVGRARNDDDARRADAAAAAENLSPTA